MMYGKSSRKCTSVRLVNDSTYYEVIIRRTDSGKQFSVTWYGCHKTQCLNPADKDYAHAVKAALKWAEQHKDGGGQCSTEVHLDKYYRHVIRGWNWRQ